MTPTSTLQETRLALEQAVRDICHESAEDSFFDDTLALCMGVTGAIAGRIVSLEDGKVVLEGSSGLVPRRVPTLVDSAAATWRDAVATGEIKFLTAIDEHRVVGAFRFRRSAVGLVELYTPGQPNAPATEDLRFVIDRLSPLLAARLAVRRHSPTSRPFTREVRFFEPWGGHSRTWLSHHIRLALEHSPVGVMLCTRDGRVQLTNQSFLDLVGYTREEAERLTYWELTDPELASRPDRSIAAMAANGRQEPFEMEYLHRDGSLVPVLVSGVVLPSADGTPIHCSFVSDITERRRSEAAMQRALERSRAATRAKADFVAMVSHEIRTPMNGVLGFVDLMEDTALDHEQRDYMQAIRDSGRALLTIINDLLDFSKLGTGNVTLEQLDFDVISTVEDALELMADKAHAKNLSLMCSVEANVPRKVTGDPGRLRQVLLNLVSNAIKFTHVGAVEVIVGLDGTTPHHHTLRLSVRDTGIGVSADKRNIIFEPFAQADASTTRRYGGTGLGLSICKRLTEMMGGDIGVESDTGGGSTFWFTARCGRAGRIPAATEPGLRSEHAVVIEPREHQRTWVTRALSDLGLDVTAYPSVADVPDASVFALGIVAAECAAGHTERLNALVPNGGWIATFPMSHRAAALDARWLRHPLPVRASLLVKQLAELQGIDATTTAAVTGPSLPDVPRRVRAGRVLVVEDNAVNQLMLSKTLTRMGMHCLVANNGREAITALDQNDFDLVLMDCFMPEMDGFEATRQIREGSTPYRDIPIVAVTASVQDVDRERCFRSGMNDFLAKPVDRDDLFDVVDRWMNGDEF